MKKILLIISIILFTPDVNAQIATLTQEYWYASKVTIDGFDYFPDPAIAEATLYFNSNHIDMGICDYRTVAMITSIDATKIYLDEGSATLAVGCPMQSFSDYYPDSIILIQDLLIQQAVVLDYNIMLTNNNPTNEYQLIISNKNGDSATFNNFTLSNEKFNLNDFKIYPNPVQKDLIVESSSQTIKFLNIYTMKGKVIKKFSDSKRYDLSSLENGIYFVEIILENGSKATKRIIKQ